MAVSGVWHKSVGNGTIECDLVSIQLDIITNNGRIGNLLILFPSPNPHPSLPPQFPVTVYAAPIPIGTILQKPLPLDQHVLGQGGGLAISNLERPGRFETAPSREIDFRPPVRLTCC